MYFSRKSKIKTPIDLLSDGHPLPGLQIAVFSLYNNVADSRGEGALWGLFQKGINLIMRAVPLYSNPSTIYHHSRD